jgi:hypothetical protein
VKFVTEVMEEIQLMEDLLSDDQPVETSIHTRSAIKKLVTSHPFVECLDRLECTRGEPIWGLSMKERDMVVNARQKLNHS